MTFTIMEPTILIFWMVTLSSCHQLYTLSILRRKNKMSTPLKSFTYILFLCQIFIMKAERSEEFLSSIPPEIELKPNTGYKFSGKRYVIEHQDVNFICNITEDYSGKLNASDMILRWNSPKKLRNEAAAYQALERVNSENYVNFTIRNIRAEWTRKDHMITPVCLMPDGKIDEADLASSNHVDIEVTRRPLPIDFSLAQCVVRHWQEMQCNWTPSFEDQKEHTQMLGAIEPIKQTVSWSIVHSPSSSLDGNSSSASTLQNTVLFSKENETFPFEMGAVYNVTIRVQALPPEYEHASETSILVNTTQIVKPRPATQVNSDLITSTSAGIKWLLPETNGTSLVSRLQYTCEWHGGPMTDTGKCSDTLNTTVTPSTSGNMTLDQLIPYTHYKVTLDLLAPGSIHWSDKVKDEFRTLPAAPAVNAEYVRSMFYERSTTDKCEHPCLDLCDVSTSCQLVTLYWKQYLTSNYYAPGFHFEVKHYGANAKYGDAKTTVNKTQHHLNVLSPRDEVIDVQIIAANAEGRCNSEQKSAFQLASSGEKLQVENLLIKSANGSDMSLQWSLPVMRPSYRFTLFWCERNGQVLNHKCQPHSAVNFSPIQARDLQVSSPLDGSGHVSYSYSTRVPEDYAGKQLMFENLLIGLSVDIDETDGVMSHRTKRSSEVTSGGITWTKALFLLLKKADGSVKLKLKNSGDGLKEGSILATWIYDCMNVCGLPGRYIVRWCLGNENCQEATVQSQDQLDHSFMIKGLELGKDYTVTILSAGKPFAVGNATPYASFALAKGAIAAIVVACVVVFLVVLLGCYSLIRYGVQGKRWFWNLPVQLPEEDRRIRPSTSSKAGLIGSQSSDPGAVSYMTQLSGDSNGSTTPLLGGAVENGHAPRSNGVLAQISEDSDEVFDGSGEKIQLDHLPQEPYTDMGNHISHRSELESKPVPQPVPQRDLFFARKPSPSKDCQRQIPRIAGGSVELEQSYLTTPTNQQQHSSVDRNLQETDKECDGYDDSNTISIIIPPPPETPVAGTMSSIVTSYTPAMMSQAPVTCVGDSITVQSGIPTILPSSISAPISIFSEFGANTPTENSDGLYSPDLMKKTNDSTREPVEHYSKYYGHTPHSDNPKYGSSQNSPTDIHPLKRQLLEKFHQTEASKTGSVPNLRKVDTAFSDKSKGGSQNLFLLPSNYVSVEDNLDKSPKELVSEENVHDLKLEMKRLSDKRGIENRQPVESPWYVDLPEKPVYCDDLTKDSSDFDRIAKTIEQSQKELEILQKDVDSSKSPSPEREQTKCEALTEDNFASIDKTVCIFPDHQSNDDDEPTDSEANPDGYCPTNLTYDKLPTELPLENKPKLYQQVSLSPSNLTDEGNNTQEDVTPQINEEFVPSLGPGGNSPLVIELPMFEDLDNLNFSSPDYCQTAMRINYDDDPLQRTGSNDSGIDHYCTTRFFENDKAHKVTEIA